MGHFVWLLVNNIELQSITGSYSQHKNFILKCWLEL